MMQHQHVHLEPDAAGRDVDRVADLYVIQDVTIDAIPSPSREYLAEIARSALSPQLRHLVETILSKGLAGITKEES